jgi:hypothetical protein
MLKHKEYYAPVLDEEDAAVRGEAAEAEAQAAAENSGPQPNATLQTETKT